MDIILRRRKLGRTSTREFSKFTTAIPVRNDLLHKRVKEKINWLIRWGCTTRCDANHTVNKAEAIERANNKAETRKILQDVQKQLKKPIIPKTWFSLNDYLNYSPEKHIETIVRPIKHAQGKKLYFCKTQQEVEQAIRKINSPYYITEYIEKEEEYRIFVMQGKIVWVAKKTPGNPKDIAWNVARGGHFDNVRWDDWPLRACRIAIQVCKALDLDFGGVDIIRKGKEYLILEINSAPSQTSPYRQECTGKAFNYLINSNNKELVTPEKVNSYKEFIHPGVK